MSCSAHQFWFLALAVSTSEAREILITASPSTERNLANSHIVHVLTALKTLNWRPSLVQSEIIANRFSFLCHKPTGTELLWWCLWHQRWAHTHSSTRHLCKRRRTKGTASHYGETKSSWSFVWLTIAVECHSNENVTFFKECRTSFQTIFWTNQICLSVAISDFKASHVAITFFSEDLDTCYALLFQSEWLQSMSWHSHHLRRLTLIVGHFNSSEVDISVTPSTPLNLSESHTLYISATL